MPKSVLPFNPAEYALVADRITLFYERYPTGRIITELVSRERDVVFKASAFRSTEEEHPAATGWASEREGDGDIYNAVACVENTETSAIGRALANLGFTASRKRPSREEMEKAERRRAVLYGSSGRATRGGRVSEDVRDSANPNVAQQAQERTVTNSADASRAPDSSAALGDRVRDLAEVFMEAKSRGMSADELDRVEKRMTDPASTLAELLTLERRLRRWILDRPPVQAAAKSSASSRAVNTPR